MTPAPTTTESYGDVWVCTDCYTAHANGASSYDGDWYVDGSDTPCDAEPLGLLDDFEVADNTCSNHRHGQDDTVDDDGDLIEPCDYCRGTDRENGIEDFSWRRCQGCGSTLGGSRYRLAIYKPAKREKGDAR